MLICISSSGSYNTEAVEPTSLQPDNDLSQGS